MRGVALAVYLCLPRLRGWRLGLPVAIVLVFALMPGVIFAAPRVQVQPDHFMAGQTVTVTGSGWAANDQILVTYSDQN